MKKTLPFVVLLLLAGCGGSGQEAATTQQVDGQSVPDTVTASGCGVFSLHFPEASEESISINELAGEIRVVLPAGIDLTSLVAVCEHGGTALLVDGVEQNGEHFIFDGSRTLEKSLCLTVVQHDGTHREYGLFVQNAVSEPHAPQAEHVLVAGKPAAGSELRGDYTYCDLNGDVESSTALRWYRADDPDGLNARVIAEGARNFRPGAAEAGCWLRFEVMPVNDAAQKPSGGAAASAWFGPVLAAGDECVTGGDFSADTMPEGWEIEPGTDVEIIDNELVLALPGGEQGEGVVRTAFFSCAGTDALQCGLRLAGFEGSVVNFSFALELYNTSGELLDTRLAVPAQGLHFVAGTLTPYPASMLVTGLPPDAVKARFVISIRSADCRSVRIDDVCVRAVCASVPQASNVRIVSRPAVSKTVRVSYEYFDSEDDPESGTRVEWLIADSESGENEQVVTSGLECVCLEEIAGRYLAARVTAANNGLFGDKGQSAQSSWCRVGAIEDALPEAAWLVFCDDAGLVDWVTEAGVYLLNTGIVEGETPPVDGSGFAEIEGLPAEYGDVLVSRKFDVYGRTSVLLGGACSVNVAGGLGGRLYVRVYYYDDSGALLGYKYGFVNGADSAAGCWKVFDKQFEVLPGAVSANAVFRVRGISDYVVLKICVSKLDVL